MKEAVIKEPSEKDLRINGEIRCREVRVVDEKGEMIGVMSTDEAIRIANARGLDLIEIAPKANPPVCRIMDFGKYIYGEKKKAQEAKKKQKVIVVKEIKLRPKIEDHDYQVKKRQMEGFLKDGNKVKVSVRFRGREISHPEMAQQLLLRLASDLSNVSKIERVPDMDNWSMVMVLAPKK
ncbi:MAG: translation initiation factor IF-3 [Acidobacteriota bacterium]